MNGFKTASEKRLAKLRFDQQVRSLINLYEERLSSGTLPEAKDLIPSEETYNDASTSTDHKDAALALVLVLDRHLQQMKSADSQVVKTPEIQSIDNVPTKDPNSYKPIKKRKALYVWWLSKDEYEAALDMQLPKSLKMNLARLRKVTEGGWIINGASCNHHSGPKRCNGIVVDERTKSLIETRGFPGNIMAFEN